MLCETFSLWFRDSLVVARRFSCSMVCGILVPQPGIKPMSPASQGGFFAVGPPGKAKQSLLDFASFIKTRIKALLVLCV